jgi:hypothetical protein
MKYDLVQRMEKDFRIAAAYTEYKENANLVFDNGEVDIDTGAVGAQRNITGQTTFKGRFAVYKDRKTKKIAWGALPDRVSKKGKKNLTPESYAEMETSYMKHMGDGAIHMSDGSPSLKKCAKVKGLPSATVVHGKHEYVKPVKFLKSSLTPKAKAAVSKRPAANSKNYYHTLAGDNAVEGYFGNLQHSRARANLHGRGANNNAHINQLASSYFMRNPGLDNALVALRVYRQYAQRTMFPENAFCRKAAKGNGLGVKTPWLRIKKTKK